MVTFVVCTHNGGDRLTHVVENLARRNKTPSVEIVIVDNASTDEAVQQALDSMPSDSPPVRAVREDRIGLAHARRTGVEQARGEIVVFVDDDNVLLDGWFTKLVDVFGANPSVAACGGYGIGCLPNISMPPWLEDCCTIYAIGSQAEAAGDVTEDPGHLWGAGLAVRREALLRLYQRGFRFRAIDRTGSRLLSGGDLELCFALRLTGWRLWYDPTLVFLHLLGESRFQPRYLRRLHSGFGAGSVMLDAYDWVLGNDARFPTRRHRSVGLQLAIALRTLVFPRRVVRRHGRMPEEFVVARYRGRFVQLLRMGFAYDRSFQEIENAPWR
jgi:glycosyltransferase involved in cell wall biosynthesis